MHQAAAALADLARAQGVHPATLAVAWAAKHAARPRPIISASSVAQLKPSLDAIAFEMPAALYDRITAFSITPAPATGSVGRRMIDFLVIGGGIAGASAAARLSALGQVTLLEAEDALAYHTSGRSAALFEQNYGKPSTIALNKASREFHETAGVLQPRGLMLVGSAATADLFAQDCTQMNLDAVSLSEACGLVPILNRSVVDRVAFHTAAWDIDTDKLIQTFVKTAKANGGTVRTKAHVERIARTATGWIVSTTQDTYEARFLVNAAGAWVDQIAMVAGIKLLGFTPLRRSMAAYSSPRRV